MTAKNDGLTFLTQDGANPGAQVKGVSMEQKRASLVKHRGADLSRYSDEEIEILWTSLDGHAQREYLRETAAE